MTTGSKERWTAQERASEIVPALVVRANRKGEPVWSATWRDSEGKAVNRTVGPAHLIARQRHRPGPERDRERRARSERWRQSWKPAPGQPSPGRLKVGQAHAEAAGLVLAREQELDETERGQERRRRRAPVVFGTLAQRYLALKEAEHADGLLKRSTILDLRSSLGMGGHIGKAFWFLPPEQVDNHAVERFLDRLRERGLSTRTREKLRSQVAAVLTFGVEQGWIDSTPLVRTRRRRRRRAQAALKFYSPEQVELIARNLGERDGDLVRVAAYTGLREGELLALRWSDVDFKARSIRVERSRTAGVVDLPKSGRTRVVPMGRRAAQTLDRHARRTGDRSTGLVFKGDRGEHLDPSALRRRWAKALDTIIKDDPSFPRLVFHALRHSYGTALARRGASVVNIQAFMGHADLSTTMIYLHYAPHDDDAQIVDDAFGDIAPDLRVSGATPDLEPVASA